jgi:phosphatidylinositol alpha-1,6-mannosyltransferase
LTRPLLVLAPSCGFGGGIERVADATMHVLGDDAVRVDLYRAGHVETPEGGRRVKLDFGARVLAQALRRRPRALFVLHAGLLPVAHAAARVTRVPVALLAVGTEVWSPMTEATRRLVRGCADITAISTFTADWTAQRAGVPREDIRVLPLAVADELVRRAEATPRSPQRDDVILTVTRLAREHRYKGYMEVAEAMPRVLERRPGARWVVVGRGNDADALERRCQELGLAGSVTFERGADDARLAELYASGAVFVLPSRADVHAVPPMGEGFGLVYAEAALFDVPSVASSAGGGALDIVEDGVTGVTVPPGDPDALAAAVVDLLEDREKAAELARGARQRTLAVHSSASFDRHLRAMIARVDAAGGQPAAAVASTSSSRTT